MFLRLKSRILIIRLQLLKKKFILKLFTYCKQKGNLAAFIHTKNKEAAFV